MTINFDIEGYGRPFAQEGFLCKDSAQVFQDQLKLLCQRKVRLCDETFNKYLKEVSNTSLESMIKQKANCSNFKIKQKLDKVHHTGRTGYEEYWVDGKCIFTVEVVGVDIIINECWRLG